MHKLFTINISGAESKFAMSPGPSNCYFAHAPNMGTGEVALYDLTSDQIQSTIKAHKVNVKEMAFNYDGSLLATTSENGLIIRIFSVPSGKKRYCLKRGVRKAEIFSLAFSLDSSYLGVTSDRGTLHVFDLPTQKKPLYRVHPEAADLDVDSEEELSDNFKDEDAEENPVIRRPTDTGTEPESGCCYGWLGLRFLADKVGSLFFEDPIETITAEKSIVKLTGENVKKPNILSIDKNCKAIIFCKDGTYYEYKFNPKIGEMSEVSHVHISDLSLESSEGD